MGRLTDDDIERVRQASDIVQIVNEYVPLKRAGRKYKACCPFHQEKTPSFQVDPEMGLWHCFGCGEGGDIFAFLQREENIDFREAVQMLADRAGIELEANATGASHMGRGQKERLKDCCDEAAGFFHFQLMRSSDVQAADARSYLSKRGFGSDVCKRWQLGFALGRGTLLEHLRGKGFTNEECTSANLVLQQDGGRLRDRFYSRIMFPIHDKTGRTVAFGGRVVGKGEPKYLNTSETPLFHKSANLFAIDRAKDSITAEGCAIVVEGYTDVIALHEAGVRNVVATLGTALTQTHVKMLRSLRPKRIVYLFDGDSAGQKAADRAIEFIDWGITPESGRDYIEFLVVVLPGNLDPAEFVAKNGKDGIEEALKGAQPLVRYAIDRRLGAWNLTIPEQRASAIASAVSLLLPIRDSIVAHDYVGYIASRLSCDEMVVQRALDSVTVPKAAAAREAQEKAQASAEGGSSKDVAAALVSGENEAERSERECLSLLAANPKAIPILQRSRDRLAWSTQRGQAVAEAFMDTYEDGVDSRTLLAAAEERYKDAAAYLSGGTIVCEDDEQIAATVVALLATLKENNLLTQIRSGNAQLKYPDQLTADEYDALFKKITTLQKELNSLQKTRTGQNRP